MGKTKVYCIIVTYNAMKWVDKCLGSLRESTIPIHPVIIDNSSSDETVEYISTNYPEVYLTANNKNMGFGQANNQGIEYAYKQGATHFFLLNQDAWINSNTVQNLLNVQDKYNFAITSPIHLNGKGNSLDRNYFAYTVLNTQNIEFVSDLILKSLKPYYLATRINAAAWMLPRKTIIEIGGFDPVFFHYGEDNNYCQRVKYHKGKIAFVSESFVYHDRELKGNVKVYNKNSTISSLLTQYADVRYNLLQINKLRFKFHVLNVLVAVKYLLKFKFKELGYILNGYVVFISKIPMISRSLKENRKIAPNWLNLDSNDNDKS
ncbi:MAG: glycosyltransferase family 2 protein [Tissierellia bacterium]|nr:glycosyltransferase family 2 protein [Tissierellia bacterium]